MGYTAIDKVTNKVLFFENVDVQPQDTETFYWINNVLMDSYVSAYWNPQTYTFYEGATAEEIYNADTRNSPDYYMVREQAGKELVRLVSDMLLKDIKSGVRTFDDTMIIEEKLDKTMASLNSGQLLTAKYKINLTQGSIPTDLYSFIFTSIDNLCNIHYA